MDTSDGQVSIHWFRHGLRLHDNPALLESLKNCPHFYPVFIFDGEVAGTRTNKFNRFRFLHECLQNLDENLKAVGGRLHVFKGDPVKVFGQLFKEWGVTRLTFEQDPEPIWQPRDNRVKNLCSEEGVECIEKISHTLYDPQQIIRENGGSPPLTLKMYNAVAGMIGSPPRPVAEPDFSGVTMPVSESHDEKFGLMPLDSFDVDPGHDSQSTPKTKWTGGETQALNLFNIRLGIEEKAFRCGIVMPNQYKPDLVNAPASLSPYLRFGCLSVRRMYWGIKDAYVAVHGQDDSPSISMIGQLIWRDYFYVMSVNNYKYDVMKGNPICLQINWANDEQNLTKWKSGMTGYPWIDAGMRQLVQEGWIHHTARHAQACFLTRGDLWINWEEGLKFFDTYLLDADWSVNAGNWMWVSSSAFERVLDCPRCFCPVNYGYRCDPTGEYISRYVPEVSKLPLRYRFSPWKAPLAVQEAAGCIIGKDYPEPIVDHKQASKANYQKMLAIRRHLGSNVVPHCAPSDSQEVRKFVWVPAVSTHEHGGDSGDEHECMQHAP